MQVTDIPLMSMLRDRMSWLSRRQDILSQNVANADLPGYTPRDLSPMNFEETLRQSQSRSDSSSSLTMTNVNHIPATEEAGGYDVHEVRDVEAAPGGNSVSLESQMIKVAETQAQYQAAANLYGKAITMMKTAIGRGGAS
jgi:flagellar basal-body rod protein FlgB